MAVQDGDSAALITLAGGVRIALLPPIQDKDGGPMSNKRKDGLLGQPHGTANNKLRKMLVYSLAQSCGRDICYRCEKKIDSIDEFSIDHIKPWQAAASPKESFFDLSNVAFSHMRCNLDSRVPKNQNHYKTHCKNGHQFDSTNGTARVCLTCKRETQRAIRRRRRVGA